MLFKGGVVVTTQGSPPCLPAAGPRVHPAYAYLVGMAGARWGRGGLAAGAVAAPSPRRPPAVAAVQSIMSRVCYSCAPRGGVVKASRVVTSDI